MFEEYYKILELETNATDDEVKKAYKKMAMKYHPDKNPDNKEESETKFKKIAEAYEILTNKDKYNEKEMFKNSNMNFVNPHELFNQLFKEMNMNFSNIGFQQMGIPLESSNIHISFGNMHPNNVIRTSNIQIHNGQRIETISQVMNGVTMQHVIINDLNQIPQNMHPHLQNILFR